MASAGSVIGGTIVESDELLQRDSKELNELKEKLRGRLDDTAIQRVRDAIIPDILDEINDAFQRGKLIIQGTVLTRIHSPLSSDYIARTLSKQFSVSVR